MATETETKQPVNGSESSISGVPGPDMKLAENGAALARARLAQKIAAISAEVGTIPKNGWNAHFKYAFVQDSDVADALREKMARYGVAMIPRVRVVQSRPVQTSKGRDTFITEITCELDLICTETGAVFTVEMPGAGEDGLDKGCYKGTTGAVKYALMKAFNISTGDDPEQAHGSNTGSQDDADREITDRQRSVIWGRARGADVSNELLYRIIRCTTRGKAEHPDAIRLRSQLDYVIAALDHFALNRDEDMAGIEAWELAEGLRDVPAGEKPAPVEAGVGGDDSDIPFAWSRS